MARIERSALVVFSADQMFRLVRDVRSYPEFLRWCKAAEIHEEDERQQLASLEVQVAGLHHRFTTRNRLVPGERLTMSLVEGPFQALSGEWRFRQLGETGSKVTLELGFDFKRGIVSAAFERGFARIADRMVQEFCERAEELYG